MTRRVSTTSLRAAAWALRALLATRWALRRKGLEATVPPPPALPPDARRGVMFVLRHAAPTCLERSLVLQRWLSSQGVARDVVIGVSGGRASFAAHAWLDGEANGGGYHEISRLHPSSS